MKKVLCLILSFVMIFSISVPTMAANLEPSNDLTIDSALIDCLLVSIQIHILVFPDALPRRRANTMVSGSMKGQHQVHGKMAMHLQFGVGMICMGSSVLV